MTDAWKKCGHDRTPENTTGRCCKACHARRMREYYYRTRGYSRPPLPLAYRNALGAMHKYEVAQTYVPDRDRQILAAAEPLTRACYLLTEYHKRPTPEIAAHLEMTADDVRQRHEGMVHELSLSEHRNRYRDWPLVQELLDAGVGEPGVKEMIHISKAQWNHVKRNGTIRV